MQKSYMRQKVVFRCLPSWVVKAEAEGMPNWLVVPRGHEQTETEEYGISSLVYTRDRPFHPKRLHDVLGGGLEDGLIRGVLRSKQCGSHRVILHTTGHSDDCSTHEFLDSGGQPALTMHGQMMKMISDIYSKCSGEHGDRHQELVFIGHRIGPAKR